MEVNIHVIKLICITFPSLCLILIDDIYYSRIERIWFFIQFDNEKLKCSLF